MTFPMITPPVGRVREREAHLELAVSLTDEDEVCTDTMLGVEENVASLWRRMAS
jgi:hypothetical protein